MDSTVATDRTNVSLESVQKLIQETPALRDEERQYWAQLVPTMNQQQLQQLQKILASEQENLQKIDDKYQGELKAVGEKYLQKWDATKVQQDRQARRQEEQEHAQEAQEKAEALLEGWE